MPESFPLTPLQHGMLFQSLYERHPGVDLVQVCGWMRQPWEEARFRGAWAAVVARHGMLRSSVHWDNPEAPFQTVHPEAGLPVTVEDWRAEKATACEEKWRAFLHGDRMRGIDFGRPPLLRLQVVRTGKNEWRFCLTFHHLILDGAGVRLLIDEVFTLFDRTGELPAAPSFREYVLWHQGRDWSAAEAFWRRELRDFTRPVPLVLAGPSLPPDETRDARAEVCRHFTRKATRDIGRLAQTAGVTVNTVMQAGWALLLSRHGGTEDVLFGATRRCRKSNVPGAERIMGMLVNTVPFRVAVLPEKSVAEWLRAVRGRWEAMRDFENTPLFLVQGWSSVPRGARLFGTIFNFFQPGWADALLARGGPWRRRKLALYGQAGFFSGMDVYAGIPEMRMKMLYDARRMDAAAVHRIMDQYETLLAGMAADPGRLVSSVSLMSPKELRLVTNGWNPPPARYPRTEGIHTVFAAQARRTPQAVAVRAGEKILTYEKLDRKANRLARLLRSRGVGGGSMVAVYLDRGLDLIAGMLGILKAGATQVPLDHGLPPERLRRLLEDLGVEVVLTREKFGKNLPAGGWEIVCPDLEKQTLAALPPDPLPWAGQAVDTACVFHTSGSTGKPRAVSVTHRGIVRLVMNNRYASFGPGETFLQFAPVSFDAASFEIWGPLLNGGQLVMFPPGMPSLAELGDFIRRERITVLWLTAGLFSSLMEHDPALLAGVREILTGGSVVPPAAVLRARRELPDCRLINGYGPTENATFTTCFDISAAAMARAGVPIGKPIAHTTVYVLDEQLRPVPVGVPGELCTGGDGVARGYLNDPVHTAERFVPDPFSRKAGARLYRTGDRVRWLADGNLEFIGRQDRQVKIRGFRVEPGELENLLARHPSVVRAVVDVREDGDGGPALHAWYEPVAADAGSLDLWSWLRAGLPAWMMPATLREVASMPLKANGKIDTAALPVRLETAPPPPPSYSSTPTQELVGGFFNRVLGRAVGGIGPRDDFFEAGGHSLKAMQLVAWLSEAFGVPVPVRTLFTSPTVESLSSHIEAARLQHQAADPARATPLTSLRPGGSRPPVFVIPGGWGGDSEMLVFARLAGYFPSAQPFYAFNAGTVQRGRVPEVETMAALYVKELEGVWPAGPVRLAGECIAGVIAYEMARQLEAAGREVNLVLLDAPCPGERRLQEFLAHGAAALPPDIRYYYEVLLRHRPGPRRGRVGMIASETSLQKNAALGWDPACHGELRILVVAGDHDSYLRAESAATASLLNVLLEEV